MAEPALLVRRTPSTLQEPMKGSIKQLTVPFLNCLGAPLARLVLGEALAPLGFDAVASSADFHAVATSLRTTFQNCQKEAEIEGISTALASLRLATQVWIARSRDTMPVDGNPIALSADTRTNRAVFCSQSLERLKRPSPSLIGSGNETRNYWLCQPTPQRAITTCEGFPDWALCGRAKTAAHRPRLST